MIEPEFATVLKATSREISTLSPTLRSAWDGRPLAILTRTAPARATSAHIAIIGHITQHRAAPPHHHRRARQRLPEPLPADRLPPRSGCCPKAATPTRSHGTGLDRLLAAALTARPRPPASSASTPTPASSGITPTASSPQPADGIVGQLTARAEAHVDPPRAHLRARSTANARSARSTSTAALALQDYAARSAAWALDRRDRRPARRADPRRAAPAHPTG